jgi:Transcriptional regulator, contains sigma factor-related N-terminal domain
VLIKAVPDVIAVAGGLDKADAIASVLRGGLANTLVTDAAVAERLLDL